jgi:hypothetical protein
MNEIKPAIYGGGPFYTGGHAVIDDLKQSGFYTVVAWAVHVQVNGNLVFNDPIIVQDGKYVGNPEWPVLLAELKQDVTSVKRLLFSIGGWGVQDFPNIKALIFPNPGDYPNNPQIGPDTILYRNFQALKKAIPAIDGIDFDDETLYDQPTTVAFSQMLNTLGYHVTFCPYVVADFWIDCLYQLNTTTPNLVTGFNLQCYAGGTGNDPQAWITAIQSKMGKGFDAKEFVYPGLWCRHGDGCSDGDCPDDISSKFANWRSDGIRGGFIWLYDDIQKCETSGVCDSGVPMNAAAYASAIVKGLQG